MPTYAELLEILKANVIRGYSHYSKSKLIDLLVKRGLIHEKHGNNKQEKNIKDIDPKYSFLRQIRNNPKKVEIRDLEADKGCSLSFYIQGCFGLGSKSWSNWYV